MSPKGKSVTVYLEQLVECSITGTVNDILRTCSVIASAKDALAADDFRSLRDRAPITDKVWSKLLQIGLDTRLERLKESLPPKWSTIYLVHNLTDEELKDAMDDGAIHPQVSQGTFNRYLKEKRFQGSAEGTPRDFKSLVQVLIPDNAQEEEVDRFKGDLDKLVSVYGFKTHYEGDTSAVALRKRRSLDRSQELMGVLFKDLKTTWENAPENLKTLFSLSSLEDLVNAPMNDFTGFLNRVRKNREGFWTFHGHDYLHKVALEYLKTTSRAQRFNYKRRLKEVAETHPTLASSVSSILEEWTKY